MIMKQVMIVLCGFALATGLYGANWTGDGDGITLEDPGNWSGDATGSADNTLAFPEGAVTNITTVTGFTNYISRIKPTYGELTIDIPQDTEWRSTGYVLQQTVPAQAWNHVILTGGGTFSTPTIHIGQTIRNVTTQWSNQMDVINGTTLSGGNVYVGTYGARYNSLVVSNQAKVIATIAFGVGGDTIAGNNDWNSALFTGKDVELRGGLIYVGYDGSDNQFVMEDGAMFNGTQFLMGSLASCFRNVAIVRDGAAVTNTQHAQVGVAGSENVLKVMRGGSFYTGLYIALGVPTSSTVPGPSTSNKLEITEGGKVRATGGMSYGGTGHHEVLVSGEGSELWGGSVQSLGYWGSMSNRITIKDGGKLTMASASTIHLGYTEGNAAGENNVIVVDGMNSVLDASGVSAVVNVGKECHRNTLIITNGASGTFANLGIGQAAGTPPLTFGSSNTVVVSGAGSACWVTNTVLYMGGTQGTDNRLIVSDHAHLRSIQITIGSGASTRRNGLLVSDGATITNTSYIQVAGGGAENWMQVLSGAKVRAQAGVSFGNGGRNWTVVSGAGSELWCTPLHIGQNYGESNRLEITDGGKVYGATVMNIGNSTSSNNTVIVDNGILEAGTLTIYNGSTLRISGTNSSVTVATLLSMQAGTTLAFEFGRKAPTADTPIINVTVTNGLSITAGAKLRIDADQLAMAGGAKDIVLVQAVQSVATATNLGNLMANLSGTDGVTARIYATTVGNVPVQQLLCTIPNRGGTVIFVR